MNKSTSRFLVASLGLLFSITSVASLREFRINRYTVTSNGYAIGWGIPQQTLDFEKIEASPQDTDDFFTNKIDQVSNYLVDLETNQILTNLKNPDGMIDFSLGGHLGNNFNIRISSLVVDQLKNTDTDAVAVIENYKWFSSLSHVFLINRTDGNKVTLDITDLQENILSAVTKNLTPKQLAFYKEAATSLTFEKKIVPKLGLTNVLKFSSEIPKSMTSVLLEVQAYVNLSLLDGKMRVKVSAVKATLK